jgi:3-oxoacyl-[acyl-carrier protein] reductase
MTASSTESFFCPPGLNKTAMVTGSSSGIGMAIAKRLAIAGWDLILHGRTRSAHLIAARNELEKLGRRIEIAECDFANSETLEEFVDSVWNRFGPLDTWINNAGADVLTGPWASRSLIGKLDHLLKVDVVATLILSQSVGQRMVNTYEENTISSDNIKKSSSSDPAAGRFSILNMGWDQAAQGMAGESGELFATTKGAIMAMTRSLAQSLAPAVRVNALAPGWIQTAWGDQASEYWDDRAKRESLMSRWGRPEDIAEAAAFLCGEQANFITGQILPVNGGFRFSQI